MKVQGKNNHLYLGTCKVENRKKNDKISHKSRFEETNFESRFESKFESRFESKFLKLKLVFWGYQSSKNQIWEKKS